MTSQIRKMNKHTSRAAASTHYKTQLGAGLILQLAAIYIDVPPQVTFKSFHDKICAPQDDDVRTGACIKILATLVGCDDAAGAERSGLACYVVCVCVACVCMCACALSLCVCVIWAHTSTIQQPPS
uniref:Uncharacterized protein n=1 Tax=Lotharella globosa TaxID=91324 RepID=A0A6V3PYJ1_9EUKA